MYDFDTIAILVVFLLSIYLYGSTTKRWMAPDRKQEPTEMHGIDVSLMEGKLQQLRKNRGQLAQHPPVEKLRRKTLISTARAVVASLRFFHRDEEHTPTN